MYSLAEHNLQYGELEAVAVDVAPVPDTEHGPYPLLARPCSCKVHVERVVVRGALRFRSTAKGRVWGGYVYLLCQGSAAWPAWRAASGGDLVGMGMSVLCTKYNVLRVVKLDVSGRYDIARDVGGLRFDGQRHKAAVYAYQCTTVYTWRNSQERHRFTTTQMARQRSARSNQPIPLSPAQLESPECPAISASAAFSLGTGGLLAVTLSPSNLAPSDKPVEETVQRPGGARALPTFGQLGQNAQQLRGRNGWSPTE